MVSYILFSVVCLVKVSLKLCFGAQFPQHWWRQNFPNLSEKSAGIFETDDLQHIPEDNNRIRVSGLLERKLMS